MGAKEAGVVDPQGTPELGLNPEKVCFVIVKAREWGAQTGLGAPTEASDPLDDQDARVLSDTRGGRPEDEIQSIVSRMTEPEQLNLFALALIGRGSHEIENWQDALRDARVAQEENTLLNRLFDMPLLADHLEEGLSQWGHTCRDYGPRSD